MKLTIDNKNSFEIATLEFKEKGLAITKIDGEKDLYNYQWLAKHTCIVED